MKTLKTSLHVVVAALATQGCSVFAVHGPPPNHGSLDHFDCTTEDLIPTQDMAAGLSAAAAGVIVCAGIDDDFTKDESLIALAVGGIGLALATASAVVGLATTSRCREARWAADVRNTQKTEQRHAELLQALQARVDSQLLSPQGAAVPGTAPDATPVVPQPLPPADAPMAAPTQELPSAP